MWLVAQPSVFIAGLLFGALGTFLPGDLTCDCLNPKQGSNGSWPQYLTPSFLTPAPLFPPAFTVSSNTTHPHHPSSLCRGLAQGKSVLEGVVHHCFWDSSEAFPFPPQPRVASHREFSDSQMPALPTTASLPNLWDI